MSFVEKHKAWLLPLLGLGVLGVVLLNVKTFGGSKPAGPSGPVPLPPPASPAAPPPGSTPPPPPAHVAAPSPVSPQSPMPGQPGGSDLWADLRPLALPPPALVQEEQLVARSRERLGGILHEPEAPASLAQPPRKAEARPQARAAAPESTAPPPDPDFVLVGPSGPSVWFEGRSYRPGQPLKGRAFTVRRIGPTRVELMGPGGSEVRSTNPVDRPSPPARPAPEVP